MGPVWRDRRDTPLYRVELWPNQSLTRTGLTSVLVISAVMLAVPLFSVAGTAVFWGLVPFLALAFWALWYGIRRNARNLDLSETLTIWRDDVRVERREPDGTLRRWQSEPMAVRIALRKDAKIEEYLTLSGAGREIELGAFLSPEERVSLADEVEQALTRAIRS